MAQLIGKDVTLGYEGNVVIEHLNFSVQAGDYLYMKEVSWAICLLDSAET